jgi:hypothetical protein
LPKKTIPRYVRFKNSPFLDVAHILKPPRIPSKTKRKKLPALQIGCSDQICPELMGHLLADRFRYAKKRAKCGGLNKWLFGGEWTSDFFTIRGGGSAQKINEQDFWGFLPVLSLSFCCVLIKCEISLLYGVYWMCWIDKTKSLSCQSFADTRHFSIETRSLDLKKILLYSSKSVCIYISVQFDNCMYLHLGPVRQLWQVKVLDHSTQ